MDDRFTPPGLGAPTPVRFPPIVRDRTADGLHVWSIRQTAVPLVSAVLVLSHGTADDPADRPGLASFVADLLDEGAGTRDPIELADALARLGSQLHIETGADDATLTLTMLAHQVAPSFDLLADVVRRPHFTPAGLARVRDLRLSRLRQLSRSAATVADRAFITAVFAGHPYGHGSLGTSESLTAMALSDVTDFWEAHAGPEAATLVVAGDIEARDVVREAARVFGGWTGRARRRPIAQLPAPPADTAIRLIDRPDAQQSELRVGHVGPPRQTPHYYALVTLNALLGGQFTSRINKNLREERALTYGARSSFDMRRIAGAFSCDTSVQADATALSIQEILRECRAVREPGAITPKELAESRASLTRGYVRNFETAAHLARAAAQLVTHQLDDDVFDRFVPEVARLTEADLAAAAVEYLHPDAATIVVVGDARACEPALLELGRNVRATSPEF